MNSIQRRCKQIILGIGSALTHKLVHEGYHVVAVGRRLAALEKTEKKLPPNVNFIKYEETSRGDPAFSKLRIFKFNQKIFIVRKFHNSFEAFG